MVTLTETGEVHLLNADNLSACEQHWTAPGSLRGVCSTSLNPLGPFWQEGVGDTHKREDIPSGDRA